MVSKQYTINTSFGLQPKNQTPITGRRFGAIKKMSDCVKVLLIIFEKTWKLFAGKVVKFGHQLNTLKHACQNSRLLFTVAPEQF